MEGIVKVRKSSCFCINCRGGRDVCNNKHLVLAWQKKILLGSVDTKNIKHHWQDVYKHDALDEKLELAYCGMWQFYQASNVICHPLRSVSIWIPI